VIFFFLINLRRVVFFSQRMVLFQSIKYLEDDAAIQLKIRRSNLMSWISKLVETLVERATDDYFAAAEDQISELKKEFDEAGILESMPLQFGGGKSVPEYGASSERNNKKKHKKKNQKKKKNQQMQQKNEIKTINHQCESLLTNNTINDFQIVLHTIYLCFFVGDNLWYPAEVNQISEDEEWYVVKFVGYGNVETIPRNWIQLLKEESLISDNVVDSVQNETSHETDDDHSDQLNESSSEETFIEIQNHIVMNNEIQTIKNQEPPTTTSSSSSSTQPLKSTKSKKRSFPNSSWNGADTPNPFDKVDDKYWAQRYRLFSKYDFGLQIDEESWYSATPEVISKHIAKRCLTNNKVKVILDPFCGVGGNVIQLASCQWSHHYIIAIDIDANKIAKAKHNASIYGVSNQIEFIIGDSIEIMKSMARDQSIQEINETNVDRKKDELKELKEIKDEMKINKKKKKNNHRMIDMVYISPPWGGPSYSNHEIFDIETMIQINKNINGYDLFHLARQISKNVAYFLPRNICPKQLDSLSDINEVCEVEDHVLNNKLKTRIAYYGNLVSTDNREI